MVFSCAFHWFPQYFPKKSKQFVAKAQHNTAKLLRSSTPIHKFPIPAKWLAPVLSTYFRISQFLLPPTSIIQLTMPDLSGRLSKTITQIHNTPFPGKIALCWRLSSRWQLLSPSTWNSAKHSNAHSSRPMPLKVHNITWGQYYHY